MTDRRALLRPTWSNRILGQPSRPEAGPARSGTPGAYWTVRARAPEAARAVGREVSCERGTGGAYGPAAGLRGWHLRRLATRGLPAGAADRPGRNGRGVPG